mgnify:CR=1 FL=1
MGIRYSRVGENYASVTTSRYILVGNSSETQVFLGSGNSALSIFNHGSGSLIWGASALRIGSGNYLFESARIQWEKLSDGWSVWCLADSVQNIITVTEYN